VSTPQRTAPPPLEGDDRVITGVITAAWAVALIVLLIVRNQLATADRWWIWVPLAGFCMGLFGFVYVPHLKRSRARAAQRREQAGGDGQLSP
jgi:Protein of unknown function (DUF2530)